MASGTLNASRSLSGASLTNNRENATPPYPPRTRSGNNDKPSLNATPRRPISRPRHSLGTLTNSLGGSYLRQSSANNSPLNSKGKPTQITEEFDGQGNKENIPPFRLVSITTPRKRSIVSSHYSASTPSTAPKQALPATPAFFPSVHIIQLSGATNDRALHDGDSFDDRAKEKATEVVSLSVAGTSPARVTRSVSSYERGGKVVLCLGKLIQLPPREANESDSGSDDDRESGDESYINSDEDSGEEVEDSESERGESDSDAADEDKADSEAD